MRVTLTISLPVETAEALKKKARFECITMNKCIASILIEHMKVNQSQNKRVNPTWDQMG